MANTYHQIYVQSVFAVNYRASLLEPAWRSEFFGVVGNLINGTGCTNIIVNGVEDHIHCFFGLIPSLSISEVMQKVKSKSSGWLNQHNYVNHRFEWQSGYGSFSYSRSHINNVFRYIQNQEAHHRKQTFRKEYISMLNRFEVKYDERYIFSDLI